MELSIRKYTTFRLFLRGDEGSEMIKGPSLNALIVVLATSHHQRNYEYGTNSLIKSVIKAVDVDKYCGERQRLMSLV